MIYFAPGKHDCGACAFKPKCCSERSCTQNRALLFTKPLVTRPARSQSKDRGLRRLMSRTKKKVEMPFAHLKRISSGSVDCASPRSKRSQR